MKDNKLIHLEFDTADYKEMYLTMMRASEKAIRILIEAQQKCEEMYLSAKPPQPSIHFHKPE